MGKTALVGHVASFIPLLISPHSERLSDICGALESELGLDAADQRLVQRKNHLLDALTARGQTVVFDGVGWTTPKLGSFLHCVMERVPVWICTRSELLRDVGHVWEYLYHFFRIELQPFHLAETRGLIAAAVRAGRIPAATLNATEQLHHLSTGSPRILCELLLGLATGRYDPCSLFDLKLLNLDRRIHEIAPTVIFDKAKPGM